MAPATWHSPVPPVALGQQAVPRSPHFAQVPPAHFVLGAVQTPAPVLSGQQSWPCPPQLPHEPALHTPLPRPTQLPPSAMQMPETQQPPLLQLLPLQHGVPGSPSVQLIALASILATEVFPTPLAPLKRFR